jgi:hypothetical protein
MMRNIAVGFVLAGIVALAVTRASGEDADGKIRLLAAESLPTGGMRMDSQVTDYVPCCSSQPCEASPGSGQPGHSRPKRALGRAATGLATVDSEEATFWGMPVHVDPLAFAVGLVAAIAGIAALVFIYREYCSNHRYQIEIVDVSSCLSRAVNETQRAKLTVNIRNAGIPVRDMRVCFAVTFPLHNAAQGAASSHSFQMVDTGGNFNASQSPITPCEKGMIAEYCLGESPARVAEIIGETPTRDILDGVYKLFSEKAAMLPVAQFTITVHSGKHQIASIGLKHRPWQLWWNRLTYRLSALIFERRLTPDMITTNRFPTFKCPALAVTNFICYCNECMTRAKAQSAIPASDNPV